MRGTRLNQEVHTPFTYSSNIYLVPGTVLGARSQILFGQSNVFQGFSGSCFSSPTPRLKDKCLKSKLLLSSYSLLPARRKAIDFCNFILHLATVLNS